MRRDRHAREGAAAEQGADRRDGHCRPDPTVGEIRQPAADRSALPAIVAEGGVPAAEFGAVAGENSHVRPPADQREHAVAAGGMADGGDAHRVDARAEFGIVEQPVKHGAELARAAYPVGRRAAVAAVAPAVAGMLRRRRDVAGLRQPDRRAAMVQAPAAGAVGDQHQAEAAAGEWRIACRRHGERPLDGPPGRDAGGVPNGHRHPLAAGLDPDVPEADSIGPRAEKSQNQRKSGRCERLHGCDRSGARLMPVRRNRRTPSSRRRFRRSP